MPRGSGKSSGEFADSLPFFEEPDGQRRRRPRKKKHEATHRGDGRPRRSRPADDPDGYDDDLENTDWRLMDADYDDESLDGDDFDDEDADWYGAKESGDDDEDADWHSHDDR